ncbi:MAG TPA: M2 family metallopeptidase, partial [Dongiaceae bacterium]|nr:M2 family metallopeptidase [Dongiaceae bacterium]
MIHASRPAPRRAAEKFTTAAAILVAAATFAATPAPKPAAHPGAPAARPAAKPAPATLDQARRFIEQANARLLDLNNRQQRAEWVQSTFITDDTERMAADAREATIAATTALAGEARRFESLALPADLARQLRLIKLSLSLPAPADPAKRSELTRIASALEGDYGKGKYCPTGKEEACQDLGDLSRTLAESREPAA